MPHLDRRSARRSLALATLLLGLACRPQAPEAPPGPAVAADGPRLLVLIAIDQLPHSYLDRFDPHLQGGLRRLLDQGVRFDNARYGHAITVTAAGHATIATGLHPSHSGIVDNYWYDRAEGEQAYSFGDPGHRRSPRNLRAPALPDWLKQLDPGARAHSIGGKDRAAIAMGGLHPDGAFWYDDENGGFRTSTYYHAELPEWVRSWNQRRTADRWFARPYEPLPEVVTAAGELGLRVLDEGVFTPRYPVAFGGTTIGPDSGFLADLGNSPVLDALVLDFARTLVESQELGRRDHLDYLALGLSSLDLAGHRYGPESPQVADTLLRVDRELGAFFDFLDQQVGRERIVIALSSDHGVAPIPEQRLADGLPAQRPDAEDALCFQQAGERVRERYGLERWVAEGFYLDRDAIVAAGADPDAVAAAVATELGGCDIVARVWTRAELEATSESTTEPYRLLYRHSFDPERSADLLVQLVEYAIPAGLVATHGSPYDYDRHVPVLLLLPGAQPARVADDVGVVDLAPTLAGLLGIAAPAVDGRDLSSLVLARAATAGSLHAYQAPTAPGADS